MFLLHLWHKFSTLDVLAIGKRLFALPIRDAIPFISTSYALKAEVDESAWAELYSTQSRPFDRPDTGKIAVKVINHYGDEVLKVFGVEIG